MENKEEGKKSKKSLSLDEIAQFIVIPTTMIALPIAVGILTGKSVYDNGIKFAEYHSYASTLASSILMGFAAGAGTHVFAGVLHTYYWPNWGKGEYW